MAESDFKRNKMTERVHAWFELYRTFISMPEVSGGEVAAIVRGNSEADYISALYELCEDAIPIGRKGNQIFGNFVEDEDI